MAGRPDVAVAWASAGHWAANEATRLDGHGDSVCCRLYGEGSVCRACRRGQ